MGRWLRALVSQAAAGQRVHHLLEALALQHSQENGACLRVNWVVCVTGVAVCDVFRANPVRGIKYEEQD